MQNAKHLQPGWKVEQNYDSGVLIGNWLENRLQFQRNSHFATSTYRTAYKYPESAYLDSDRSSRIRSIIANHGLAKKFLLTHHGCRYSNNLMSMYHQDYNSHYDIGTRKWDSSRLIWSPEKSDHPMEGTAIRYGLKEQIEEKWKKIRELETHGEYSSSYRAAYRQHQHTKSEPLPLKSTAKNLSSSLHPHNGVRILKLRDSPFLVQPEGIDQKLVKEKLSTS